MVSNINSEKFRVLSIVALVTCILAIGLAGIVLSPLSEPFSYIIVDIFLYSSPILSLAAIVCGSIDLQKIQAGRYSNKGRGFDITGIVLGGIPLLILIFFLLGELLVPH